MIKIMSKVILGICLCLGLLWGMPTIATATEVTNGTCGENLTWTLDDSGTLTISGSGAMADYSIGNTPWFSEHSSIIKVVIGGGVTVIGDYAFNQCCNATSVSIPDSVTAIGDDAFSNCNSLTSITIPDSTLSIGNFALHDCTSLTNVVIPNSVTTVGDYAFSHCTSLASVTIGSNVTSIGNSTFLQCSNLTTIRFYGDVPSFGDDCFSEVNATAYYPANNASWTADVMQNYGGTIAWGASGNEPSTPENPSNGYSAGLSTLTTSPRKGDSVNVNVSVSHETDSSFNAGEIIVTYDTTKLAFDKGNSSLGTATVSENNGALKVEDYGTDKTTGNSVYSLAFDTIDTGITNITLTSAAFIHKENAAASDLIPATIIPATVSLSIQPRTFSVSLPNGFSGTETVQEGSNYSFSITDKNHTYSDIIAKVNGTAVPIGNLGNGTYMVYSVTGALTITATATPKAYSVTFSGNAAEDIEGAATTATYGTNYSFTIPSADGWDYKLESVTIAGTAYSGYTSSEATYTIPGAAIIGDIVITVTKEETQFDITVNGASGDVSYDVNVQKGEDVTITLTPEAGYSYIVTATMNGKEVDVIDNGDGTYTVKNVTGDLIFSVEKVVIADGVAVTNYLTIDGSNIWLVKNSTTVAANRVPSYDGKAMFWSEEYQAYCYLVLADTLDADTAKKCIGIMDGTAVTVDYGMDVNKTGKVDASDAQLVYNIYNAQYSEFTTDVTMEKLLRADVNKTGTVTVEDAAAIINAILTSA